MTAVDAQSWAPATVVCCQPHSSLGSIPMLDVILLAAALGFFALSVGYTIACDRL